MLRHVKDIRNLHLCVMIIVRNRLQTKEKEHEEIQKESIFHTVFRRRVIHPRPWMALIGTTSNQGNILFHFTTCLIGENYQLIFLYLML